MGLEPGSARRTRGVAAVSFAAGLLAILQGMALFGVAAAAEFLLPVNGIVPILAVATLVYATLCLTLAYGLAAREPWAWTVGVASQLGGIGVFVLAYRAVSVIGTLFSVALAFAILAYLARPHVRAAIESERP